MAEKIVIELDKNQIQEYFDFSNPLLLSKVYLSKTDMQNLLGCSYNTLVKAIERKRKQEGYELKEEPGLGYKKTEVVRAFGLEEEWHAAQELNFRLSQALIQSEQNKCLENAAREILKQVHCRA